jgi:hypothetical protein
VREFMARQGWLKKAVGEISKLRQGVFGRFGSLIGVSRQRVGGCHGS